MRKRILLLSWALLIITVLPSINVLGEIWVDPNIYDINTLEGLTVTRTLTIGNDGIDDLSFLVRTRRVGSSPAVATSSQRPSEKIVTSSIPPSYDLKVVEDVPYKPGELIVRFANKSTGQFLSLGRREQVLSSLGGANIKRDFTIVRGLSLVQLPAGMNVEDAVVLFNESDDILYAQPNYQVQALSTLPNDSRFSELWGMHNTGQSGGTIDADIDAPEAWDLSTGSSDIVVAVIDTGVDYTHPDLAANMWVNEAEFNGTPGLDDDGNGYIDDIYGYDFYNNDGDPWDDHYHGTHCAGTIGGIGNNNQGVAGVCWNVRIMAVKFLSSGGSGWTDDAISSVEYSTAMGANLSSNSWGGGGYSQGLKDAIDAAGSAGMLFVAAAGNDSSNNDTYSHYPSSYDSESIIAVMATDDDDNMSSFSNYGSTSVDLGAPGSNILSCEPGNQYQYLSGTSMATPHVSGACALLWSVNPSFTNSEIKDILIRTVDKTLSGLCVSDGRLNLYNALLETRVPWITVEPDSGTVAPADSNELSVTFDAMTMAPGTYEAEIIIVSNDPCSPEVIPVTMVVNPDDLVVTPAEGFASSGSEGGPFEPACMAYTLTNNGTELVNWVATETADWLEANPNHGVLDPNDSIEVSVCILPEANLLDPNIYDTTLTFKNADSNSIKPRSVTLTVKPPDYFTESFGIDESDLAGLMLTFSPDGSVAYYEACREEITEFPTDPNGGVYVSLGDDDFVEVSLVNNHVLKPVALPGKASPVAYGDDFHSPVETGGIKIGRAKKVKVNVLFYGTRYNSFFIGSNGYITFGSGDTEFSASLENHFNLPRISGLFTDLSPSSNQNISYKQLDDRIAVTFEEVPLYGDKTATNSFQVEMFFVDGTICISWLKLASTSCVTGLSEGNGLPPAFFVESDLSEYPACWPYGDFDRDYSVNFVDFAIFAMRWLESDCNIPYWCEKTDLNWSGMTDIADLSIFAENWLVVENWWLQPISHWKFDEGAGDTAYDSVGTNDGTLTNSPVWTTGLIDGALQFDGSNDYVNCGNDDSLNITGDITISAWVNIKEGSKYQAIVTKTVNNGATNNPYDFRTGESPEPRVALVRASATEHEMIYSEAQLSLNEWHLVAVTVEANLGTIYIDGQPSGTHFFTITPTSNNNPALIGARDDGLYFDGLIDDVRIYDRALTDIEILQLYEEGLGSRACNPNPSDEATNVDPNVVLSWLPGKDAISHDVYFGINYNEVNDADITDPNVYMGNQDVNSWDPNNLDFETNYYWRIDERNTLETVKGNVWSFTTANEPNIADGLLAHWKLDEPNGTTAYDSVGDNDGTLYGDPNWTTGQINGALEFDGDGDYVQIADDDSLTPSNQVTISYWVYRRAGNAGIYKYVKCPDQSPSNSRAYYMNVSSTTNKVFLRIFASVNTHDGIESTTVLSLNQWYLITGTFDNGEAKIYINGALDNSATLSVSSIMNDAHPMTIGGYWEYCNDIFVGDFDGIVDDVRIYDKALTDAEIQKLYNEGISP